MGNKRSSRFGGVLWGGVLVALGTYLLLAKLGLDTPDLGTLWPIFPFTLGVAFLASFFGGESRDPGPVCPGTLGVLLGLFFFAFTLGFLSWEDMGVLWPCFPLIVGLSFLATWLAYRGKQPGLLVPAGINLLVGLGGLALTLGVVDLDTAQLAWPIALIAVGVAIVLHALFSGRARRRSVGGAGE